MRNDFWSFRKKQKDDMEIVKEVFENGATNGAAAAMSSEPANTPATPGVKHAVGAVIKIDASDAAFVRAAKEVMNANQMGLGQLRRQFLMQERALEAELAKAEDSYNSAMGLIAKKWGLDGPNESWSLNFAKAEFTRMA